VKPHESAAVDVTVTVPPETPFRAMAALFCASNKIRVGPRVGMALSLGTLLTFTLSKSEVATASPVEITPQSTTRNLTFAEWMTNSGTDPIVPKGVAAVLRKDGSLVGKTPIEGQRLLPGERLQFKAEYPDLLPSGEYRALLTLTYGDAVTTSSTEFRVQ
jgi:hypothetical protein